MFKKKCWLVFISWLLLFYIVITKMKIIIIFVDNEQPQLLHINGCSTIYQFIFLVFNL